MTNTRSAELLAHVRSAEDLAHRTIKAMQRSGMRAIAPYGMFRLPSGNYFVFNRDYKPLGEPKESFADYETFAVPGSDPLASTLPTMMPPIEGSSKAWYFFTDDTTPWRNSTNALRYRLLLSDWLNAAGATQ